MSATVLAGSKVLGKFLGRTVSEAAAFSAGVAIGPVLGPVVAKLRNDVNARYPENYPDAGRLAEGVSQGQVEEKLARKWASYHGIGDAAFSALVAIANVGPGLAQAFNLWRRLQIDEAGFRRALKRMGLEPEWIDHLWNVREEVLDTGELANAIHRGLVPDPGLLAVQLNTRGGKVPDYPVYPVDAIAEAHGRGLNRDRLGVLVGLTGLPLSPRETALAVFRHLADRPDFNKAVAQSNMRNEWADLAFELARQIPTARDFLENALRGYSSLEEAIAGAEMHGMTAEHATLIYQNQGRPMPVRRITQALARGARFNPEPGEITDPYRASIVEGSLKPAYYELEEAMKYTPPSVFAIRQLAQAGTWGLETVKTRLLWLGWVPEDAEQVAQAWTTQRSSTTAKEATAADEQTLYSGDRIDRATLLDRLAELGYKPVDAERKTDVIGARLVSSARTTAVGDLHARYKKSELRFEQLEPALAELGLEPWIAQGIAEAWRIGITFGAAKPASGPVPQV